MSNLQKVRRAYHRAKLLLAIVGCSLFPLGYGPPKVRARAAS